MRVLIADKFPEDKIDEIKNSGCSVIYNQGLKDETLLQELKNEQPEILVVRSTVVTKEMIEAASSLSLIIRAGSGYNTIDVKTASERSIYVANCPGKNSIAVAELAFGLLLSIDRRIPDNVMQLRNGRWNKKEFSKSRGIFGKTLGIIGVGRIGREMITRAKAFGMHIVAWSRSLTQKKAEELGIEYAKTPQDVAAQADVVSVHLALTEQTDGIIGSNFFNAMKKGAYFINTSRAEIVDDNALLNAMSEKEIRAGLDVFTGEPPVKEGEFKDDVGMHERIYGTHHIGASTDQAQSAVAEETVRIVSEYINSGRVFNCVNLLERTPASYMVTVHHRNHVGVLASVLDIIREVNINVETMENIIFDGASGACARIQIDGKLSEQDIKRIQISNDDIFSVSQAGIA